MDATVVVGMGFATTILAVCLTAYFAGRGGRQLQLLEARLATYGRCSQNLYEFQRATYDRVKTRLGDLPDTQREPLRQKAYEFNSATKAAIGQVAILTRNEDLMSSLETARQSVQALNDAVDHADLRRRRELTNGSISDALATARADLQTP